MTDKVQITQCPSVLQDGVLRGVWRVTVDGRTRTIITSSSSMSVMGDTAVLYYDELKRLADL